MADKLSIVGMGIVSSIGSGAEINAAIMRCNLDGFILSEFIDPVSNENIVTSPVSYREHKTTAIERMAEQAAESIEQAYSTSGINHNAPIPIILCLQSYEQPGFIFSEKLGFKLFNLIRAELSFKIHQDSCLVLQHRAGFVTALKKAQEMLNQAHDFVVLAGVENNCSSGAIAGYLRKRRLLSESQSDGFIPGEAASSVMLCSVQTEKRYFKKTHVQISGIGLSREKATLDACEKDDAVLLGAGLTEAMKTALNNAGYSMDQMKFIVSSLSGESYFFEESSLSKTRCLQKRVETLPLWHPADCIGEVGSAVGGAMSIMASIAMMKQYAPGNLALCQISNDDEIRGAFVLEYPEV